jgi:acylphosphatase
VDYCKSCACQLTVSRSKRYLVRGYVQGVGYRYFAASAAQRLGVKGFVRNLPNGDVEVHAEADDATLQLFKRELERGPRMAQVSEVLESDAPESGAYSSFLIRG